MKIYMALLSCIAAGALIAQQSPAPATIQNAAPVQSATASTKIQPGSKLYIQPMEGFESYLSAAILKKKVPVTLVDSADASDFILTGSSRYEKASWAKTIFVSPNAHAEASITVKNAKSGAIAYAYTVDKANSVRGNQSTAEACAKHLKEEIEKR